MTYEVKERSLFYFLHNNIAVLNDITILILVVYKLGTLVNLHKLVIAPKLVQSASLLSKLIKVLGVLSDLDRHRLTLCSNHLTELIDNILECHCIEYFSIARSLLREIPTILVLSIKNTALPEVLDGKH